MINIDKYCILYPKFSVERISMSSAHNALGAMIKLAFNKTLHVNTHELFIISPKSGDNKMLEEISRC